MESKYKTQIITDNHGRDHVVYRDLKIGTKLKCIKDSFSYTTTSKGHQIDFEDTIKGNIYVVHYISDWGWQGKIPCVNSERNCAQWAEVDMFEIIED